MKSISLEFEILYEGKPFLVGFESNKERNLLMHVIYDNFELDTAEIRKTHPELWKQINGAMANNASSYWEELISEENVFDWATRVNEQYKKIHSL